MASPRLIVSVLVLSALQWLAAACAQDNLFRALQNAGPTANTFCMQYTQTSSLLLPSYIAATYPASRVSSACTCLNAGLTTTALATQPCASQTVTVTLPPITVTSVQTVTATKTVTTSVVSTTSVTESPLCAVTGAFRNPALADYQFFYAGDGYNGAAIEQCESNCISTTGCLSYALQILITSQACYLYSEPVAQERDTTTTDVALYFFDLGCVVFPVTSVATLQTITATASYTTTIATTVTATSTLSRPIPEEKNQIQNAGFEAGQTDWTVIFPNDEFSTPTGYNITSNPADVYTGSNAFFITGNVFVTLLEQQILVTQGNPYAFSVFAKLTADSASTLNCIVSLVVAGTATAAGGALTKDWQNYVVVWPGSTTTSNINVGVEVSGTGCTQKCVFDDFFFTI